MNAIQKIRSLHTEIVQAKDGFKIVDAWALAERLLGRMPCDQSELKRVCKEKDAAGLDALITFLESPAQKSTETNEQQFTDDDLAAALRAFRKRLKLMRLSDESRLGGRYTSGGRQSNIDAIQPPDEFPPQIWKTLARVGKLKDTGRGFYAEP